MDEASTPGPPKATAELEAEIARLRLRLTSAERRCERLQEDLQHRMRNMLAVIRSVARRTAQASGTAEDCAMHLDGRLGALTRAQSVMVRSPEGGISLEDMIAEELIAHAAQEGDRVSLLGPPVRLRAKAVEALWLAVHELAVNAVKFGALSNPCGRIAVGWRTEPGQTLHLEWRESGVPLQGVQPGRGGFGTDLIERTLAYELGATASLAFGRDGACCTIVLPLTEQVDASPAV